VFSVVEVTGPVFYMDWTGRRVEIREQDSLTKDDLVSSLSKQSITLKNTAGQRFTLDTDTPRSVEQLINQSSAENKRNSLQALKHLEILNNEYKGTMISDEGIGAYGQFKRLNQSTSMQAQEYQGRFGSLIVFATGEWFYHFDEATLDGIKLSEGARQTDAFTISVQTRDLDIDFAFDIKLQGSEDIPEIVETQLEMLEQHEKSVETNVVAENEIMSMIDELLTIN